MDNALAKTESSQIQGLLKQMSGPGMGREFDLGISRMTIGRAESNHIVIQDESISRMHAFIEPSEDGDFFVFDNQSRNGVQVNGKRVDVSILRNQDSIQIGSVKFFFEKIGNPDSAISSDQSRFGVGKDRGIKINKRLILYGGVGLILAFALLSNNKEDKPAKKEARKGSEPKALEAPTFVPSPDAYQEPIADPSQSAIEKELESLNQTDSGVLESETYFRKGQREYFNKNYHRAINAFEVALSLNKSHPAAGYYLKSAIYQAEKEAQRHFEMGLKYFESLQYQRAIYHFQQTQSLLAHKQKDNLFGQVDKYIKLSRQRLQAAEMFP